MLQTTINFIEPSNIGVTSRMIHSPLGGLVPSVRIGKCPAERGSIKALDGGRQALEQKTGLTTVARV